jgi:hypothetical protein
MVDPAVEEAKPEHHKLKGSMFVTVGATASFKGLLEEITQEPFLAALKEANIDRAVVQCGPDHEFFEEIRPRSGYESNWIQFSSFAFTDDMRMEMAKCNPSDGSDGRPERGTGIIVCHAGKMQPRLVLMNRSLTQRDRLGHDFGGAKRERKGHCRPQPYPYGQPSNRAGRLYGREGLCRERQTWVWYYSEDDHVRPSPGS